jgi:hypothetical protein
VGFRGGKKRNPKEEKKMEKNVTHTECELKHIREEGLDPSRATEICGKAEGSRADEKSEKSSEDQRWDFYGD